ncbi:MULTISPECIES: threonine ammonia-lyase [Rhodomicrobium]|uniref:threonine ammonia-lyase n=1 Tax=Rhodomicrobium TaxID=1068 RepID=UPI000B4B7BED|nr:MULTISPECIES: threonine ammonia-lyase [Rhodomicrobium]
MTLAAPDVTEPEFALSYRDIFKATKLISGRVLRTPTLPAPKLSQMSGAQVFVKYENLQVTGSFKDRGALVKLLSLSTAERKRGVIAMSAGNHAQSVAYHARRLGIPALIVMPEQTPFVKVSNTEGFGAEVVLAGETVAEAREMALTLGAERGLTFVHPYDDPYVIAGQGTLGAEFLEDQPDLDCAILQIGGGGLIAGCAIAMKKLKPSIEIFGVETELYPSMKAGLAGETPICGGQTLAEGIAVKSAGSLTLPIVAKLVSDIILVSEQQIEQAVSAFLVQQKTMAEGAGAAGLAALLAEPERFRGRKVGLVLSGGNIDVRMLASVLVRGLEREDKIISLRLVVDDQPGMLGRVATCLGEAGANILEVSHRRMFLDIPAKGITLDVMIETKDAKHAASIMAMLEAKGFSVFRLD